MIYPNTNGSFVLAWPRQSEFSDKTLCLKAMITLACKPYKKSLLPRRIQQGPLSSVSSIATDAPTPNPPVSTLQATLIILTTSIWHCALCSPLPTQYPPVLRAGALALPASSGPIHPDKALVWFTRTMAAILSNRNFNDVTGTAPLALFKPNVNTTKDRHHAPPPSLVFLFSLSPL
ncbi:hypothetical protein B0J17DRAFT_718617 [Rhizoctonia solani]|nr:hypothetical protein B0J17DRAFT_718617 [Rhizoctonia solani]